MAATKLKTSERVIVLKLLATGYSNAVILNRLEKQGGFPQITDSALDYYREKFKPDLEKLEKERWEKAIKSGLALKAERIARLCEHADELELIKWVPAENGRYWNEKAWRETLDDIAREMGERRPTEEGGAEEVVKVYIGVDYDKV